MSATPWIEHDWPPGGADPFDPAGPDPMWLLADSMAFWGRGWPAGDELDFGGHGEFYRRVPMGYRAVQIRERIALVQAGEIVHASRRTPDPPWLTPWGETGHLAYDARPRTRRGRTRSSEDPRQARCATEDEALDAAIRLSQAEPDEIWLVSRGVTSKDWH